MRGVYCLKKGGVWKIKPHQEECQKKDKVSAMCSKLSLSMRRAHTLSNFSPGGQVDFGTGTLEETAGHANKTEKKKNRKASVARKWGGGYKGK